MCIEQRPTAKKLNDYNSMVQNAFKTVTKLENAKIALGMPFAQVL